MRPYRFFLMVVCILLGSLSVHADERTSKLKCINLPLDREALLLKGLDLYREQCLPELRAKITLEGASLSDRIYDYVLATIVSHYSAPYGSSNAITEEGILKAETLNCGNYGLLVSFLTGEEGFDFVGFEGGAIGNHQQLFYESEGVSLLLDPTIGMIAFTDFDHLMSGKSVEDVFSFYSGESAMQQFNKVVLDAVTNGKYRPSDLLYYYEDINHVFSPGSYGQFPTPGGVDYRARQKAE